MTPVEIYTLAAFNEGRTAFMEAEVGNPYASDTNEFHAWLLGWNFGKMEAARAKVDDVLFATANLNFPSTDAGSRSELTVDVPGAAIGDVVSLGVANSVMSANQIAWFAWVSAADTVSIRFTNNSAITSVNPGAADFNVIVWKIR